MTNNGNQDYSMEVGDLYIECMHLKEFNYDFAIDQIY